MWRDISEKAAFSAWMTLGRLLMREYADSSYASAQTLNEAHRFFDDQKSFTSDKDNKLRFWQSLCIEVSSPSFSFDSVY
jgi:hypothetical protein